MKISKISRGLALVPLVGIMTFTGTSSAFAAECSILSPCVASNPTPALSSLTNVLTSSSVQVSAPQIISPDPLNQTIQLNTAPIKQTVNDVAAPVVGTVKEVTAPVADTVEKVTTPIAQVPAKIIPKAPVLPVAKPMIPAVPVAPAIPAVPSVPIPAENSVAPSAVKVEEAKPASETSVQQQKSSSASSDATAKTSAESLPNEKPAREIQTSGRLSSESAAVYSSQGQNSTFRVSGGFGFGYLDPNNPMPFIGLMCAYIIILGSAVGFAVKRSAFRNLRDAA